MSQNCKHKGPCDDTILEALEKALRVVTGERSREGDRMVALVAMGDYETLAKEGYTPTQALVVRALSDVVAAFSSREMINSLHEVLVRWEFTNHKQFEALGQIITERTGETAESLAKKLGLKSPDDDEFKSLKHVKPVGNC